MDTADDRRGESRPNIHRSFASVYVAVVTGNTKFHSVRLLLRIYSQQYVPSSTRNIRDIGVISQRLHDCLACLDFSERNKRLSCLLQRPRNCSRRFGLSFRTDDSGLSLLLCLELHQHLELYAPKRGYLVDNELSPLGICDRTSINKAQKRVNIRTLLRNLLGFDGLYAQL